MTERLLSLFLALFLLVLLGCGSESSPASPEEPAPGASVETSRPPAAEPGPDDVEPVDEDELEEIRRSALEEFGQFTGDLDGMLERKTLRVATTFSRTQFFFDGPQPRGSVYDIVVMFVDELNQGRSALEKVYPVFVPVARDQLLPALLDGRADLAAAQLTVTEERQGLVDFSNALARGISEIVVTGPGAPPLESLDDLAGQSVHLRRSSSYFESLSTLSDALQQRGLEPIQIVEVDELLEPEDILELVAGGVYPITVVSDYLALLWAELLDGLVAREDLVVATDRRIAWALRKDSPQLAKAVNAFVAKHKQGSLMGNILIKRYYQDNKWIRNPVAGEGRKRYEAAAEYFQRYASQYDIDWLLTLAQGYQESRLDQSVKSTTGAVGIMQIKPSTAADPNVGIDDVHSAENNVHAGIKYLEFLHSRYFSDADIDPFQQVLFSLAAYNAGPARVGQYRRQAAEKGLDPDRWVLNVEQVSNPETATYVRNILKYYVSYREYVRRLQALEASPPTSNG